MKKVIITGGSGYFGSWVVKEFVNSGFDVLNFDARRPDEWLCPTVVLDLNDAGQIWEAMATFKPDVIVHLAAIAGPKNNPAGVVATTNIMATHNILEAAAGLGVKKAVLASSDSTYGIVFSKNGTLAKYVPVDEDHPQIPEDVYGFSKLINEENAKMINRRTGMQIVCLRFVHVAAPSNYNYYIETNSDISGSLATDRKCESWNYIDARDGARACVMAADAEGLGYIALNIAADDTVMNVNTMDLLKKYYPEITEFKGNIEGCASLTSNKKAKEILGWKPQHSWREVLKK